MKSRTSWHQTNMRWIILFLIGFYPLIIFFVSEYPALLGEQIKNKFQVSQSDVNYLLTFRSMPDIFMSLIGGLIIDTIGVRRSYILFCTVLAIGQLFCFISVVLDRFYLMLFGRFIFGVFESSGYVAEGYFINKWFKGKENALAFGIDTALCRIGSIIAAFILPYLSINSQNNGINDSLLVCFYLALFVLFIICILAYIDKLSDLRDGSKDACIEKIDIREIKRFNFEYFSTIFTSGTCYSIFFVFSFNNVEFFKHNYSLSSQAAENLFSIAFYFSALLSPLVGHYMDKYGNNIEILTASSICQVTAHFLFYSVPYCTEQCLLIPVLGQILNGIFFGAYFAVMFPQIPLIVPQNLVGTGFGFSFTIMNTEILLLSLLAGYLVQQESYENYSNLSFWFFIISIIGFIPLIYLYKFHRHKYHKVRQTLSESNQIELVQYDQ